MTSTNTALSSSTVTYAEAKKKAYSLISTFKAKSTSPSTHYPHIDKSFLVQDLKRAVDDLGGTLDQQDASLCGPAAFIFTLNRTRPDIYVSKAIELYENGSARLGKLELKSSVTAKNHNPQRLSGLDWMMFSSLKPKYDTPKERFDGITWPGQIKNWLQQAGFKTVEDKTNLIIRKGYKALLQAQQDYASGHTIILFVDANLFIPTRAKGSPSATPNHWVVLNSDIKVSKYNAKTKTHAPAGIVSESLIKKIKKDRRSLEYAAQEKALMDDDGLGLDADIDEEDIETHDRISMKVFTWGDRNAQITSRINRNQRANLSQFMQGFYGYIKVKM